MKKHVSIITLNGDKLNYGNKLQNFAIVCQLIKYNLTPITINFYKKNIHIIRFKYLLSFLIKKNNHCYFKKQLRFIKFERKFLNYKNYSPNVINKTLYYIIGSDQVWNTNYWNEKTFKYYLGNFDLKKRKIGVSVSMGIIPTSLELLKLFENNLSNFSKISCREKETQNFLSKEFSYDSELLIDPVLSIKKDEWCRFIKTRKKINFPYVLLYFVGVKVYKLPSELKTFLEKENLRFIDINASSNSFDPFDFVNLIQNAKIVVTNSYHASLFSFIFDKPFIVLKRDQNDAMFIRISEFLSKFRLENKCIENINYKSIYDCDYAYGKSILDSEIDNFKKFII